VWVFVCTIALATFFNDLTMGSSWASCLDIGKRFSGIVSGCMNTIGNLGGAAAGVATGWVLDRFLEPVKVETTLSAALSSIGGAISAAAVGGSPLGSLDYGAAGQRPLAEALRHGWTANFIVFG